MKIDQVVVLKGHPFGVYLPQHVLGRHFADGPTGTGLIVGAGEELEGMSQLMGQGP